MNDVFRAIDDQIVGGLEDIDYDVGDLVYCEIEDKVKFNTEMILWPIGEFGLWRIHDRN